MAAIERNMTNLSPGGFRTVFAGDFVITQNSGLLYMLYITPKIRPLTPLFGNFSQREALLIRSHVLL